MKYGFVIPGGDITELAGLARDAEEAGWDGVFVPDCICIPPALDPDAPGFDPWVGLAAMAISTHRIRLGTMVTPVSRRRPWKLARETASVDRLSGGRLVLSVGLGALDDVGFAGVGEATDRKTRAELLDEGLDILAGLWSGKPFSYEGKHYRLEEMTFLPPPAQSPRVPVWVVGAWPRAKSMQRALKWDGLLPGKMDEKGQYEAVTPDDIRAMRAYVDENRRAEEGTPFDIVVEGESYEESPERTAEKVRGYAEAGLTWWLEAVWTAPRKADMGWLRERLRQGPPRIE